MEHVLVVTNKNDEKILRKKTEEYDIALLKDGKEREKLRDIVRKMREAMRRCDGVGLSANQIGLPHRLFVAQIPDNQGKMKSYAVLNPNLEKMSDEKETIEEGCLSVPRRYGPVPRHHQVTLTGYNPNGKKLKIKAWGLLARVFQHEIDHLDGKLFIDRATTVYETETEEGGGQKI